MAWLLNLILGPHRFETRSPWGIFTGICAVFAGTILSLVTIVALLLASSLLIPDQAGNLQRCAAIAGQEVSRECSGWALAMMGAFALVLTAAFVGMAYARKGSTPANALLLRAANLRWWQYLALVAVMMSVVLISETAVSLIGGATQADLEQGTDYIKVFMSSGGLYVWVLIIATVVLAGPFVEEVIFRGFMFTTLIETRAGFIGAAVITSACWTVLHYTYSWQTLTVLFIFGVCLSYVVWRTGSLWPGVIAHGANNLVSTLIFALR
ncbi:MAG: CPBP family intramembrane glutamic endopeptidase [Aestuariivirgaceae bacterium]